LQLNLVRDSEEFQVEITPGLFKVEGVDQEIYGLGTQLQSVGTVRYPWWQAPVEGVLMVVDVFVLIATTLWHALIGMVAGQSNTGLDVTGPVGIAVLTGDIVKLGFITFMQFVAILSINLAFLNLLPIPALDGGRFAFLLFEMIARRPVSEKLELKLHQIGFSLLLLLIIVVTIIDVGRFSGSLTGLIQGIF
jgi:regulator of sigma E protease